MNRTALSVMLLSLVSLAQTTSPTLGGPCGRSPLACSNVPIQSGGTLGYNLSSSPKTITVKGKSCSNATFAESSDFDINPGKSYYFTISISCGNLSAFQTIHAVVQRVGYVFTAVANGYKLPDGSLAVGTVTY